MIPTFPQIKIRLQEKQTLLYNRNNCTEGTLAVEGVNIF